MNMSYCMCENTLSAMNQVIDKMNMEGVDFISDLSESEFRAYRKMFEACQQFTELADYIEYESTEGAQ